MSTVSYPALILDDTSSYLSYLKLSHLLRPTPTPGAKNKEVKQHRLPGGTGFFPHANAWTADVPRGSRFLRFFGLATGLELQDTDGGLCVDGGLR